MKAVALQLTHLTVFGGRFWAERQEGGSPWLPTIPSPGGEGGPKGRERNSGGNFKVSTNEQTFSKVEVQEEVFRFFVIVRLPPAFLFSHQSVPKSRLATARNCGVIAPGNHWILDSLRGALPPGEAFWRKLATFLLLICILGEARGAAAPDEAISFFGGAA